MATGRVRALIGEARAKLASVPDPLVECDRCRLKSWGRLDRTVCLHPTGDDA